MTINNKYVKLVEWKVINDTNKEYVGEEGILVSVLRKSPLWAPGEDV